MNSVYWTPAREWAGQDVYCIGGGPSLKGFDFNLLKGRKTIGCNDAYHLGGDIVRINVFGDAGWWHRNKFNLEKFTGRQATNAPSLFGFDIPSVLMCKRERDGYHTGDTLGWNYSTGALAVHLAGRLGAGRIWLLGYDLMNDAGGHSHWHDLNKKATQEASFKRFLRGFHTLQANMPVDIDVVNVTDGSSNLKCFRMATREELLHHLAVTQALEVAA